MSEPVRKGDPFVVVPVRYRREHSDWSNAEVAAWLDLLMASYQVGGTFDTPNVARAYLGGRAGALDALIDRGAFVEIGDSWQLADYVELYDESKRLRPYLPNAVRVADAEAKLERGEPLTEAERKALQRSKRPEPEGEVEQEGEERRERSPDVSGHVPTSTTEGSPCPLCDRGRLVLKEGKRGQFLSCDRYPDCRGKADIPVVPRAPSIDLDTPENRRLRGEVA